MADPIVIKVSELTELTELATGDLITVVDVSEPIAANKTKKLKAGNIKVFTSDQIANLSVIATKLATDAVETAKIKDLNVTTAKLAANAVTAAKLRKSAALSVIGNGTNASADPADIAAGTDGYVLRRSGTNLAFGQVANAGIADNAITEAKLGTIKRTLVIRVMAPGDIVTTGSTTNFFPFPVTLNNFVIVDARINLSVASTSGSVTVLLKNQGGTMTTLTLAAGATGLGSSGTIAASYKTAITNNFLGVEVTQAGTGARGLIVTLVLEGIPS